MNRIVQLILLTALLNMSIFCFANTKVILAVENSWPPYSNSLGDRLSKDMIKNAYKAVNVDVEFLVVPYARALHMVENGTVDGAFNVTKQHNTESLFNFGEEYLLQATASFFYHSDVNINYLTPNHIPDGTVIALIIGYEYGDEYQRNKHRFKEVRVAKQEQIVKLLRNKRVDIAIMFDEVAKETITNMDLQLSSIKRGHVNHRSDIYVAFSKKSDTKEKMMLLDEGLRRNRKSLSTTSK
jgi:polar amino acid transport system substrate-binding protein